MLKNETLNKLGHEDKALVLADEEGSQLSLVSQQEERRPKAIDYLKQGGQQKESVRDFIENTRKILQAQISINDKTEETELLKEYIIMEKEKLDDGRKIFNEDKDKYEKFKMEQQAKQTKTEDDLRAVNKEIENYLHEINLLKK